MTKEQEVLGKMMSSDVNDHAFFKKYFQGDKRLRDATSEIIEVCRKHGLSASEIKGMSTYIKITIDFQTKIQS